MENTNAEYGLVAKLFHWGMALLILGVLGAGLVMSDLADGDFKWQVYGLHKATGILILSLVVFRFIWRKLNVQPDLPDTISPMQN